MKTLTDVLLPSKKGSLHIVHVLKSHICPIKMCNILGAGLSSTATTLLVSTAPPFTSTQCEVCRSCSTSVALASVITAIITALLATVIFVLEQIAVCMCHPKFTPGGAETGTSAGEGEGQEYEQMDTGEGGVAMSDPTYMEACVSHIATSCIIKIYIIV